MYAVVFNYWNPPLSLWLPACLPAVASFFLSLYLPLSPSLTLPLTHLSLSLPQRGCIFSVVLVVEIVIVGKCPLHRSLLKKIFTKVLNRVIVSS